MSDLFIECVKCIKRYPSILAYSFPALPKGCYFVICPPIDGRWNIDVKGKIFTYKDYLTVKKDIKL